MAHKYPHQRRMLMSTSRPQACLHGTSASAPTPCSPTHRYKGPPIVKKRWMLRSITGEFASDELPAHPSPSFPPEAVVQAQLEALR
jgi:hypothetical protein